MIAPLQLIDFHTATLAYERLEAEPLPDDMEMGAALAFEIEAVADEEREAQRIELTLGYNQPDDVPEDVAPHIQHRGRLRVTGWIRWIDKDVAARDDARQLLLTNGLAMLYGVARVRVADLTDDASSDRLILPSANFHSLVMDWMAKEEKEASGEEA
jgi:hypothetical protein